ncbi:prefoldin subunit 6 [Hygrophoropsis aurantiaca]|uniref:Prefoldin subunit 6 n=1 Tax=Hygrophoropsis aurantiaca TaxID=72124 RepID=A0ACB8AI13_9AGAM|nr:prefoldin subunit 6 [Hygrophoropsis aurantiaca]
MSLELQTASAEYQKLQHELATLVDARTRLDTQLSESEMVKKEFTQLVPSNTVYKLIGPVLVQQDQAEAKANVQTRLDFIQGEIKRVDNQIKEIETKSDQKKDELVAIQEGLQQNQPQIPA